MSFSRIIALRKNERVAHAGAVSKRATVSFDASQCRGIQACRRFDRGSRRLYTPRPSDGRSSDEAVRALRNAESGRVELLFPLRMALRARSARSASGGG